MATRFVSADGTVQRRARVLTVDLGHPSKLQDQLQPWKGEEVLHAVAGVCSVCLPDMEVPAIYSALTTSTTLLVLTDPAEALTYRSKRNIPLSNAVNGPPNTVNGPPSIVNGLGKGEASSTTDQVEREEVSCFNGLISGDESSDTESDGGKDEDPWAGSREKFLVEARQRAAMEPGDPGCVGPEHCVLGCASFLKLGRRSSAVQVTLLAVRRSCRKLGIGRHLMQLCKDPEVVGLYNALLAFADPKAEGFFQRHGFSEDPILTAKYKGVVDYWENSTLMVYTPPFSSAGLALGSISSLVQFQDSYKAWRDSAVDSYCTQLCVMERLRHELLLLHTKVQSQEEVIGELTSQLTLTKQKCSTIEREFLEYRKNTQKLLCSAAVEDAEKWLEDQNTC